MVGAILHFGDGPSAWQRAEDQSPVPEQEPASVCAFGRLASAHLQGVSRLPQYHQQTDDGSGDLSCLGLGFRGLGVEKQ